VLRNVSIAVLIGLLTDAHPPQAASWTSLPPLPQARFGAAAAGLEDRLFVLGGYSDQGALANATVWNQTQQGWSEAAPMSRARLFFAAAATPGSLFALGGFVDGAPTAEGERLDVAAGTWTPIAPMPMARASFGAGAIGGALYVAGGQGDDSSNLPQCLRYDPATDAWASVASLPTPRSGVAAAVLEGRLWVMGGMDGQPLATVEVLDPGTDQWSAAPSLPEPLWFAAAASFDGRVWVAGGMDASYQRSDRVYSAASDGAWRSETALPAALALSAAGTASNCLVLAGGMDAAGTPSALAFAQCVEAAPPPPPPSEDPLPVAVTIHPQTLNPESTGPWLSVEVEPQGWSALDIQVPTLYLNGVPVDPAAPVSADPSRLTVKFPRAPFASLPAGPNVLPLVGQHADGRSFGGEGTLVVLGSTLQVKGRGRALVPSAIPHGNAVVIRLERPEEVRLDVIDLQGRLVERLVHGTLPAGEHVRSWPSAGSAVSRGAYFMRLRREAGTDVVKLLVVR
jgi:N-acetylneuraminic acid mutarotase